MIDAASSASDAPGGGFTRVTGADRRPRLRVYPYLPSILLCPAFSAVIAPSSSPPEEDVAPPPNGPAPTRCSARTEGTRRSTNFAANWGALPRPYGHRTDPSPCGGSGADDDDSEAGCVGGRANSPGLPAQSRKGRTLQSSPSVCRRCGGSSIAEAKAAAFFWAPTAFAALTALTSKE